MAKKKQEVLFLGFRKTGGHFVTPSLAACTMDSTKDPIPVNRKSKRAMLKIIHGLNKEMSDVEEQKRIEARRLQKEKRKKAQKTARVSRRLNRIRKRAA